MDFVELDKLFLVHLMDCLKMQKLVGNSKGHQKEQDIIDKAVYQLQDIINSNNETTKRSQAQKVRVMYDEHSTKVQQHLSGYVGPKDEKSGY